MTSSLDSALLICHIIPLLKPSFYSNVCDISETKATNSFLLIKHINNITKFEYLSLNQGIHTHSGSSVFLAGSSLLCSYWYSTRPPARWVGWYGIISEFPSKLYNQRGSFCFAAWVKVRAGVPLPSPCSAIRVLLMDEGLPLTTPHPSVLLLPSSSYIQSVVSCEQSILCRAYLFGSWFQVPSSIQSCLYS